MIKWIKKLRAKWTLYRIRHFKRYKRKIKIPITENEIKQAFTSPVALDQTISDIIERVYNEANKDFIRLRLEAGEFVSSEDDTSAYPDIFDKYNI